jgi:glycosyltransferase involved in cell wall biosynthesis
MKNNLNFLAPIGYTGYGITSFNILKELHQKCKISLFCLNDIKRLSLNHEAESALIRETLINNRFFDRSAPSLKIWHPNDLAMTVSKNKICVFPFFELDFIPDIDRHHINSCDYIFTASSWGKTILENNGINIPIIVSPLGVDMSIFKVDMSIVKKDPTKYVFFSIGKWEKRKSQDVAIECFSKAFCNTDNVELWLFPHNPFLSQEETKAWFDLVENSKLRDKIKIFPRLPTQYDLNNAINLGDCGLFLSRAEGWNNEIIETMAVNKPVICTNYSAHTEYCTQDNSYLIPIDKLEPAIDNKWFHGEGNWANIDNQTKDYIVDTMKFVYNNNIRTNTAGLNTANYYSWSRTSDIIYNTIYANT